MLCVFGVAVRYIASATLMIGVDNDLRDQIAAVTSPHGPSGGGGWRTSTWRYGRGGPNRHLAATGSGNGNATSGRNGTAALGRLTGKLGDHRGIWKRRSSKADQQNPAIFRRPRKPGSQPQNRGQARSKANRNVNAAVDADPYRPRRFDAKSAGPSGRDETGSCANRSSRSAPRSRGENGFLHITSQTASGCACLSEPDVLGGQDLALARNHRLSQNLGAELIKPKVMIAGSAGA